jgi:ribosomal protein L7/L12
VLDAATFAQVVNDARTVYTRTSDIEATVEVLREGGCSVIESIKAVREIAGIDLGIAKSLVHHSAAYADQRANHEAFHRAVAEEFGLDPRSVAVPPPPRDWSRTTGLGPPDAPSG